jgi:hypothetical protein
LTRFYKKKTHTAKIESTDGEAKTSPETAAVNIPAPTNPAWAGSWPLPPPTEKSRCHNKKLQNNNDNNNNQAF